MLRHLLLLLGLVAAPLVARDGTLVIVGGGLSAENTDIYRAFVGAANGGDIAVIPSASGEPQASLDSFAANLQRYGVAPSRIKKLRLALVDDPATTDVDEAGWDGNANAKEEIAKLASARGIWFTGGDQLRTIRLLMPDGKDTPMLTVIRKRLAEGAVVGGTSAGAAIMGSGMIVCGDPRRSSETVSRDPADCAPEEGRSEPLVLGRGLGFLPGYVVDQHFGERGRLPRLVRAVACGAGQGVGIDEDTAIVVELNRKRARVAGRGSATAVLASGRKADCAARSLRLDQYRAGEQFGLPK